MDSIFSGDHDVCNLLKPVNGTVCDTVQAFSQFVNSMLSSKQTYQELSLMSSSLSSIHGSFAESNN